MNIKAEIEKEAGKFEVINSFPIGERIICLVRVAKPFEVEVPSMIN